MFGKKKPGNEKEYVNIFDQEPDEPEKKKKDPEQVKGLTKEQDKQKEKQAQKEKEKIEQEKEQKEDKKEAKKEERTEEKVEESSLKQVMSRVIEPEERTFKNYINPKFWVRKSTEYVKLREKEQNDLNVYAVLSAGATPTIDYYILTVLSCLIATSGLIQGSTATIIGAMIVAPLMTPILAFSLGVVWGEITLIRVAFTSILKGMFWAILISALLAYIVPMHDYSAEIISRTTPTFYDILVAIASGIVGAYGYTNKNISNTIVGIAIAVALMPPLCTIGIGLGTMNMTVAYGATLLFSINLVAISLAGAIIFWVMKVHPIRAEKGAVKKRALSQIVISVIILGIISFPVAFYMYEGYEYSEAKKDMQRKIENMSGYRVFSMNKEKSKHGMIIKLVIMGNKDLEDQDKKMFTGIKQDLMKKHPRITDVQIRYIKSLFIE